jgi:hypothetical protein
MRRYITECGSITYMNCPCVNNGPYFDEYLSKKFYGAVNIRRYDHRYPKDFYISPTGWKETSHYYDSREEVISDLEKFPASKTDFSKITDDDIDGDVFFDSDVPPSERVDADYDPDWDW